MIKISQEEVYSYLLKNKYKKFSTKEIATTLNLTFNSAWNNLIELKKSNEIRNQEVSRQEINKKIVGSYIVWWIDDTLQDKSLENLFNDLKRELIKLDSIRTEVEFIIERIKKEKR